MMSTRRRRVFLVGLAVLTVSAIVASALLAFHVDREQCRAAATAVENSRTMWEYAIQQNPGPEADEFLAEMNRRIPPAHCVGGTLVVDEAVTTPPTTTTGVP